MNNPFSVFNRSLIHLLPVCAVLFAIFLGATAELGAQLLQPVTSGDAVQIEIQSIYKLTKSAKATTDFEQIVQRSERLLETELTEKDRNYLNKLIGWSENRWAEKHVQNAAALRQLGLTEQADEQLQLGIGKFDQVIQHHPLNWRAWMGRAVVHVQLGQYEPALEKFRQVTRLNSKHNHARFNCAEIGLHLKLYEEAIADFSRLIAADPTDVQSLTGRGHCFFATNQFEMALEDYRTVVHLRPDDAIAHCNAGDAYLKLEQWPDAKLHFESATEIAESGLGLQRLANFHVICPDQSIADPSKAIALIHRAIDRDGTSSEHLTTLAAAYRASGQFQLADQTLTQANSGTDSVAAFPSTQNSDQEQAHVD